MVAFQLLFATGYVVFANAGDVLRALIGQPAPPPASPGWWVALGAAIGAILTALGSWWNAARAEKRRQDARWESFAEQLWKEKLPIYARMIKAVETIGDALAAQSIPQLDSAVREIEKASGEVRVVGSPRVTQLAASVLRAGLNLLDAARGNSQAPLDAEYDGFGTLCLEFESAMRADMGTDKLSALSDKWFDRSRVEAMQRQAFAAMWQELIDRHRPPQPPAPQHEP